MPTALYRSWCWCQGQWNQDGSAWQSPSLLVLTWPWARTSLEEERSRHLRGHGRVESVATKGLLPGPPQAQLLPGMLVAGRSPDLVAPVLTLRAGRDGKVCQLAQKPKALGLPQER